MVCNGIRYRYADIGHYIARCDHQAGVIELNRTEFPRLSPMMKDFVWCHECVHLIYGIRNESKCNEITYRIFVGRARNERERRERTRFVSASKGSPYVSNLDPWSEVIGFIVDSAVDFTTNTVYNKAFFDNYENGGFASLDLATQKKLVDLMMAQAFRKSRRVDDRSAKDFFWLYMEQYVDKTMDSDYSKFISRHRWVSDYIAQYEKKYGFAFDDVARNNTDLYLWTAVGTIAIIVVILLIKKYRK